MSLKTLAQSLGLSITTVSRALDGYADVAPGTRERVRAAADAMGYRPNAAARRLRRGAAEVVMLVLPTLPGRFDEPLYIELMGAMGGLFAAEGFDLTLLAAPPGVEEIKTYRRIVEERRADGLVVVRTRRDDVRIRYLLQAGLPFVAMGRSDVPGCYPSVDGDGMSAFRDATRRLLALGHRRIAHVAAPSAFAFAGYRRTGYEAAMAEARLPPVCVEASADEAGAHLAALGLLGRSSPPTAILCATDRMAFGVLRAAREYGLEVPRHLSVVGHDNVPAAAFADPALTTMELPLAEAGAQVTVVFIRFGLYDTPVGVALVHTALALPFAVLITASLFVGIPRELEEAAWVFGCTRWQAVRKVVLPLAMPGLAAAAVFAFVISWNEVFAASVLTVRNRTLTAYLLAVLSESPLQYCFAGGFILIVPSMAFIFAVRRYLFALWGVSSK